MGQNPAAETVFQKFVLYMVDDCVGSQKLMQAMEPVREEVRVVNVRDLETPLPPWLVGTPTLVDTAADSADGGMFAYRGTEAIQYMETFVERPKRLNSLEPGGLGGLDEPVTLPDPGQEPIDDRPRKDKVTDLDVEELMRQREQAMPSAPTVQY